jgi:DNA excision repair protein ERCC-2
VNTVSVSALCEFAARTGSLEFRYTPAPSSVEGIMGHRTVQERRPEPYIAEYALKAECKDLIVSGAVDGYFADKTSPFLEEIKTYRGHLNRVGPGKRALHWAQLKIYGALFCQLSGRTDINLRLTYFEVRHEEETHDEQIHDAEGLWAYLETLCQRYSLWLKQEQAHRIQRDQALRSLAFPFGGFREGQRELSESVYKAVHTARPLLLQAPTGIGKTVGVLFPALHAMPVQKLDRLFYLTCRNTAKQVALEGLRMIIDHQQAPTPIRVLELSSLEQACDQPDAACHGDSCPLAKDFFDKLDAARNDAFAQPFLDAEAIRAIAKQHGICRYFFGQEMARWADIVVADVNHYFDQHALLFALTEANDWRVVPLIDEAHNLIDRARSMYSLELAESEMLYTIRKPPKALQKSLARLEGAWNEMVKPYLETASEDQHHRHIEEEVPDALNDALYNLIASITDYLTDHHRAKDIQHVLFTASGFLRLAESFGDHSLCTLRFDASPGWNTKITGSGSLAIDNLIPADHLAERFKRAHAVILFSATLSPPEYNRDLLGLPEDTVFEDIPSPFRREQLDLRLVTTINTRFDYRSDTLPLLAERIHQQTERKPGNYLVFLSSLAYVDELAGFLQSHYPSLRLHKQTGAMTGRDRTEFVRALRDPTPSVGLAVLGGIFGEGLDLPGEQLVGVFVITLGLPPPDENREILKQRLEARYGAGYDYAYLYPAMTKVIQAAGRLIRTPTDRGVLELIDDRFTQPRIKAILPRWWEVR